MKMQMWCVGVARVAEQPQNLPTLYLVPNFDAQASGLQVRVESRITITQIKQNVVTTKSFKRDRHCSSIGEWDVFRQPIFDGSDDRTGNGEDFRSIGIPVRVICGVVVKSPSVRAKLDPVGGEALCDLRLAIDRDQGATMYRYVGNAVRRQPAFAA